MMGDACNVMVKCERTHHALGPLVDDLDKTRFECAELLGCDLLPVLYGPDALGDGHDGVEPLLELGRDDGLDVGLFLEDEAGEEGDDFLWLVVSQCVLEDELRQNELVGRVDLSLGLGAISLSAMIEKRYKRAFPDLACDTTLQEHG